MKKLLLITLLAASGSCFAMDTIHDQLASIRNDIDKSAKQLKKISTIIEKNNLIHELAAVSQAISAADTYKLWSTNNTEWQMLRQRHLELINLLCNTKPNKTTKKQ